VHPLINWRHSGNGGSGGRNTESPLVDIATRLRQLDQQEVFTVQTAHPSYLRITALSTFSGSGWSLDDTYRPAHGDLPASDPGPLAVPADVGPATTVTATVHVSTLQSLWLPAPYRPVRVSGVGGVSYSADAASIITSKPTSDGLTYTVTSSVPEPLPATLEASAPVDPGRADLRKYLALPSDLSPVVRALAQQHATGATPYQQAKSLQDWLRSPPFRYDLNVPADQSQNALVNFLTTTRAGFCQQFAASFAVLARAVGLPTRVAVGFTQGDRDSQGIYHVKNADAHAWPEVWFDGVGWVAFEPTPGRGSPDPSAQAVTGAAPQQAESSTTPTTQAGPAPAPGSATTLPGGHVPAGSTPTAKSRSTHDWWTEPVLLAAVSAAGAALLWALLLGAVGAVTRSRRRRTADSAARRVNLAWSMAGEALATVGLPPHVWETPAEFAARVANGIGIPGPSATALLRMAAIEEFAAYSPGDPTTDDVLVAESALAEITAAARAQRGPWRRFAGRWDPRPVLQTVAAARAEARQARVEPTPTRVETPELELEELSPRA
jgi:transglutaminase-like putative cysteine protease